jgi:very-short-patch-repair endonuclease
VRHATLKDSAEGDAALAALAARQGGVVSVAQLHALGFDRNALAYRVRIGRLHRVHRGVYAVGHTALAPRGYLLAAVLACGPEAVASHRSAAAHYGLRPTSRARHDVTAPTHRRPRAIDVHRSRLHPIDVTEHDGVPITTIARTFVDLADVVPADHVAKAFAQADILRLVDVPAVSDAVDRACGRRGQGVVAAILANYTEPPLTRSELEDRMFALLRRARLPLPTVNAQVQTAEGVYVADFLWPEQRLIAETDGFATHGTRTAFESDRRRDAALQVAGFRVVRFTWRQVRDDPQHVARILRALLTRGEAPNAEQFSVR